MYTCYVTTKLYVYMYICIYVCIYIYTHVVNIYLYEVVIGGADDGHGRNFLIKDTTTIKQITSTQQPTK